MQKKLRMPVPFSLLGLLYSSVCFCCFVSHRFLCPAPPPTSLDLYRDCKKEVGRRGGGLVRRELRPREVLGKEDVQAGDQHLQGVLLGLHDHPLTPLALGHRVFFVSLRSAPSGEGGSLPLGHSGVAGLQGGCCLSG